MKEEKLILMGFFMIISFLVFSFYTSADMSFSIDKS